MKKVMYNLGMVAILGLGVLVNAQIKEKGAVGINTQEPKATLDIRTFDVNGTTNEGIIAPKLTKERVANIKTPVEGTLVYVTDATYTGNSTEVAKIDDKGYYYFDGTEWVKAKGAEVQGIGATNGLSKTGDNIELGGTLIKATNINLNGKNLTASGDGNVGIGVNNPTAKLEVEGVVKSNYAVKISRNGSDAGPYLQLENPLKTTDGSVKQWRIYNMTGAYPNSLQFWAYNDKENLGSKMILTDTGNVALGVPSNYEPTHRLELRGGDASLTSKDAPMMIGSYENDNTVYDANEIMARNNGEKATLYLNTDGGDIVINSKVENNESKFYFKEGQGLGIGISNPTARLDVNGNARIRTIEAGNPNTDYVVLADTEGNIKKADVANFKGPKGDTGAAGAQGPAGAVGPKGDKGEQGDSGVAKGVNGITYNEKDKSVALGGDLTEITTINQNNNNLTFTTGETGKFIVDGTSKLTGAQYVNIRIVSEANFTLKANDYMINYKGRGGEVTLPAAKDSTGRVVCFYNYDGGALATGAQGNAGNIQPSYGGCIVSDGTEWITKNAY